MKKLQLYQFCLKSGTFQIKPTFKIKIGKFQKIIQVYFICAEKQIYNYDTIIQRINQSQIQIQCYSNSEIIGIGQLKFDQTKEQQSNESVDIIHNKAKIASIECSLKIIEKRVKNPPIDIDIIQGVFKKQSEFDYFIVLKYGQNNYKTKLTTAINGTPIWKQRFKSGQSEDERLLVECWEQNSQNYSEYLGLTVILLNQNFNSQKDYQVIKDQKNLGLLKIGIQIHEQNKQTYINDKNFVHKRTIKVSVVEAIMRNIIKKGAFIRFIVNESQFDTRPIYNEISQLQWNQSFNIQVKDQQMIIKFCIKDEIEEELAQSIIKLKNIQNKRYEIDLLDGSQTSIGKLYLQFFDHEIDIKEQIYEEKSQIIQKSKKIIQNSTAEKILNSTTEIKNRYSDRLSINDYMNELNAVLQEGLIKVGKERPNDPIRELGLYLINYKK